MKSVTIYTDGACSGNPGVGGWAAVLCYKTVKKEICGAEEYTTNNRMELTAVIEALKCLNQACKVSIFTDSSYIFNAFTNGWIYNWMKNGWKTSAKKPVENQDLWKELIALTGKHTIVWNKVKGHADNELNNRCDKLATGEAAKLKKVIAQRSSATAEAQDAQSETEDDQSDANTAT